MKRPIAKAVFLAAALAGSGCGQGATPQTGGAPADNGWIMPPIIEAVAAVGSDLVFSGRASPLGRVVIGGPGGQAYAVGADREGRFDLRVPRPAQDTLFTVEARAGQRGYPAPYRLLVGANASGPIGLVSVGAATKRLDAAGPLDAVDSDGSARLLSGRAAPRAAVLVDSGQTRSVSTGTDGRWMLSLPSAGLTPLRVGASAYVPPNGQAMEEGRLERSGAGWRITWSTPAGARQTTWFPDRPGHSSG